MSLQLLVLVSLTLLLLLGGRTRATFDFFLSRDEVRKMDGKEPRAGVRVIWFW